MNQHRSLARPLVALLFPLTACSSGAPAPGTPDASQVIHKHPDASVSRDRGVDAGFDATLPSFDSGFDAGFDGGCVLPTPAIGGASRAAALQATLLAWAQTFEAAHAGDGGLVCPAPSSGVLVHDLTNLALTEIALTRPNAAANATALLECAFQYQQYSATSPGPLNGAFNYRTSDTGPLPSTNSTELVLQAIPAILASGQISASVVASLRPRIVAALHAVEQHAIPITYTSMWLTQAMELAQLGGDFPGPADARRDAGSDAAKDAGHDAGDTPVDGATDGRARDGDARDGEVLDAAARDAEAGGGEARDSAVLDASLRDAALDAPSHDAASHDAGLLNAPLGDAASDAGHEDDGGSISLAAEGQQRLAHWSAFTASAGITEFDTPIDYEVDLDSLWVGYQLATGALQSTYASILGLVWQDISANALVGRGNLAGPNSHLTDFFRTHGDLEVALYLEGLRLGQPVAFGASSGDFSTVFALWNALGHGFHPTHATLCLSQEVRAVQSTFALTADASVTARQRYTYFTRTLALGSASSNYVLASTNDEDELVQAEFAAFDMPVITVLPDYLDSPGIVPAGVSLAGPAHLALNPAAAQHEGAMLVLLKINAKDPKYTGIDAGPFHVVNLSTNIMFPAGADEVLEGGGDAGPGASPEPMLVIRQGAAAIAVRVLDSTNIECPVKGSMVGLDSGVSSRFSLSESFPDASIQNVGRLALYHASTQFIPAQTSLLATCFARVALLVVARECQLTTCTTDLADAVANAEVTDTWNASTGIWDLSVVAPAADGGVVSLHVTRGFGGDAGSATRLVDDAAVAFVPLEVNGVGIPIVP